MHVAGQTIELRDDDRGAVEAGVLDRGLELRPAVQGVGALAGLDLLEGGDERRALALAEAGDGLALGVETDVAALFREAEIGDGLLHTERYIVRF